MTKVASDHSHALRPERNQPSAGAYVAAADRLDRKGDRRRDREQYEGDQADATLGDVDHPMTFVTDGLGSGDDEARRGDESPEHAAADANLDAADDSYDSAERRETWAADI